MAKQNMDPLGDGTGIDWEAKYKAKANGRILEMQCAFTLENARDEARHRRQMELIGAEKKITDLELDRLRSELALLNDSNLNAALVVLRKTGGTGYSGLFEVLFLEAKNELARRSIKKAPKP